MSKEQIKAARRKQAGNYAFLAPAAIIYLSVIVIPLIYSIYISFHKWNGVKAMEPVGIANYIRLFTEDDVFKTAFRNNLVWILLSVVVATALALAFALVLVKKFRGRTFFRGVFYFPCVVAPIAVAIRSANSINEEYLMALILLTYFPFMRASDILVELSKLELFSWKMSWF